MPETIGSPELLQNLISNMICSSSLHSQTNKINNQLQQKREIQANDPGSKLLDSKNASKI